MTEENKKFFGNAREINRLIEVEHSKLIRDSEDNSFVEFLKKMHASIYKNIEDAISEREVEIEDPNKMLHDINRYTSTILDILIYRNLNKNYILLFKKFNLLINNWFRLTNDLDIQNINKDYIQDKISDITRINNILDGNLNLRDLIDMNRALINRAEKMFYNAPYDLDPSRSFMDAMKIAIEEENGK